MAIQVSGSTVIHDSQDVQVSGMFTASSFVGDASQLTNLPASGGTLEATASGTLADGSKVIINTDGTVSVVAQTETTGAGTGPATVFESASTIDIAATFDSTNNKVVIAYCDQGNSSYGTAVVGTVSGTSISFGTPVVFDSSGSSFISVTYDSTNQRVVIAYQGSSQGRAVVGSVSGTTIIFGSPTVFNNGSTAHIAATFDSSNNKVVIAYRYTVSHPVYYGRAIVGTVSGISISFGSVATFDSDWCDEISATFDSSNNKVVIAYKDGGNSFAGTAIVGTVSGTSISFGSSVVFESNQVYYPSATFDSSNNKVVIAYNNNYTNGTAIVGTVSGTSISFGTPVVFSSTAVYNSTATFDSTNNKIHIAYADTLGKAIVGTVSGTSISFDSPVSVNSSGASYYIRPVYDSSNQKTVIAYRDGGNSNYGTAAVFVESGLSIPQVGSATVFETGSTEHLSVVYDSSNQKVVIAYMDSGNSSYGTVVVGEVSGTSISFGTPVLFNSATSAYISAVYDPNNQKIVIAYTDYGNSEKGTAIVGTVSGTSISFGSSTVFETGSTYYISAVYDSSNQKVVIAYSDNGNSYYGTAVVGTVSGTSISFGSPVVFASTNVTNYISAIHDSTNGKVVIGYSDVGNSYYGTAVVGTVSGTSISFGSEVVFESSASYFSSAVYDSSNQKVVISYAGSDDYGKLVVGTVSGTSISFGSSILFESGRAQHLSATYDSSNNKVVIAYGDAGNSIQGTSVVFSPVTLATNLTAENFIGISNGAYSDGQTATIQVTGSVDDAQSGLTAGQAYYVQDNGTLGESGSVFAGTAVSASKIIVKG